ncbi:MAG: hypothetical protein ABSG31_18860 [Tepidisphaeraceae bacterium]|jgi:hypothetical protein
MLRALYKSTFYIAAVIAGSVGLFLYYNHNTTEQQLAQALKEKQELQEVIQRLQTDRRVARILVTDQTTDGGQLKTTLLFEEFRRDGSAIAPKQFIINGDEVHFDAEIVKFKDQYVQEGDPLRGQSIMLFTKVYGADQAPADGFPIDTPGQIPEIYRGIDPKISDFEQNLWANFWKLYNDQDARESRGIRGLHGEGLWGIFLINHVYTITLRPDGGTITEEAVDPIYQKELGK